MIYVDRNRVPAPAILTTANTGGMYELQRNIQFAINGEFKKMTFSAYSDQRVKVALVELFKGKCAYCESSILQTYPGDVEHFRPKGEIAEAVPSRTPGYYWLAANWDNLLLSCRNCNQQLYHELHNDPDKKKLGKMNQFPLANNYSHVQTHIGHPAKIVAEEAYRLLLNPCKENPELYLEYDEVEAVIKPKDATGMSNSMAKKSIEVYVLQRVPLVHAREKMLIAINAQIQIVIEADNNCNDESLQHKRAYFDLIFQREMAKLKSFIDSKAEYAGMARQIIVRFLKERFGITI